MKNRIVFALGMIAIAAIVGCGKEESVPVETDPVKARMADPEYVAKLENQNKKRDEIVRSIQEAKKRLAEAKAAGESAEVVSNLENTVRQYFNDLEFNRAQSQMIVRKRILEAQKESDEKKSAK